MNNTVENSRSQDWKIPVSAAFGGGAGAYLCFPFEALKKKLQSNQPITRNSFFPIELYRGSSSFATSVTAATVSSMTFRCMLQSLPGYDSSSAAWEAASAITSGMLGATVGSTPVENIILTQQLKKCGPIEATIYLFKQHITRPWVGLPELAMREAGFAGVMMWGGKAAREAVYEKTHNPGLASAAEIGASLIGATLTQPFDALATRKQFSRFNSLEKNCQHPLTSTQAIKDVYARDGFQGFFKGLSQRAFLFTGCALVIPRTTEFIRNLLNAGT